MILAALAFAAAPVPAAETPRHFVERLYAGYRRQDYSPLARPTLVFAPPLAAAISEDRRLSGDEVGFLDGDPVCDCQDPAGLRARIAELPPRGPAEATIRVTLRFGQSREGRLLTLRLARTAAGWRIADVATPDSPSLLQDLEAANQRRRR
ncbi:MAG: hypothetical protein QOK17_518 [Sphingomonadales bacterium]|nr:hypothetical protein [Sphingomonadales bacterium]